MELTRFVAEYAHESSQMYSLRRALTLTLFSLGLALLPQIAYSGTVTFDPPSNSVGINKVVKFTVTGGSGLLSGPVISVDMELTNPSGKVVKSSFKGSTGQFKTTESGRLALKFTLHHRRLQDVEIVRAPYVVLSEFRLLLDVDGNGGLNPKGAPAGGDLPVYLPGYSVGKTKDPLEETESEILIVKPPTMDFTPAGVRGVKSKTIIVPQFLFLVAQTTQKVGSVSFFILSSSLPGICTNFGARPTGAPSSSELGLDFYFQNGPSRTAMLGRRVDKNGIVRVLPSTLFQ